MPELHSGQSTMCHEGTCLCSSGCPARAWLGVTSSGGLSGCNGMQFSLNTSVLLVFLMLFYFLLLSGNSFKSVVEVTLRYVTINISKGNLSDD